jgi:hypothetical protein
MHDFSVSLSIESATAEELAKVEAELITAEREFDAAIAAERALAFERDQLARAVRRTKERRDLLWHHRGELMMKSGAIR